MTFVWEKNDVTTVKIAFWSLIEKWDSGPDIRISETRVGGVAQCLACSRPWICFLTPENKYNYKKKE